MLRLGTERRSSVLRAVRAPLLGDPEIIQQQISADRELIDRAHRAARGRSAQRATGKLDRQEERRRARRRGAVPRRPRLRSARPSPGAAYELTVLGDLHGCYSVPQGHDHPVALLRARSTPTARTPSDHPEPQLVLLGDYIDRGLFSLNGVLRTVLQLFVTAPDHVVRAARQPRVLRRVQGQRCTAA